MVKALKEWKPTFTLALRIRDLLIVTSHTNRHVTTCPIVLRRHENADGDALRQKTSNT